MKTLVKPTHLLALALSLFSCDLTVVDNPTFTMEILNGDELTGRPGETLSPIEVRVMDADNNPVKDVQLTIEVSNGSVEDSQPRTNTEGIAAITWTLGDTPGVQNMTISGNGLTNSPQQVKVSVEQISYNLEIVSGNNQFNAVAGEELGNPFVVQVIDPADSEAIEGVVIRFEVDEDSGASFGGIPEISQPTDSEGRTDVTLTMGPGVLDTIVVEARLASTGTAVSNPESVQFFVAADKFIDERDGQEYRVVRLKDGKVWMAENLNYDASDSWCYNDGPANCIEYGRLYTWSSALEACPSGWYLPTDEEWREMAKHYGGVFEGAADDGQAAYQALIKGGATGFDARLGGWRNPGGSFGILGSVGGYWSATEYDIGSAWLYYFDRDSGGLFRDLFGKSTGHSCRCVRD